MCDESRTVGQLPKPLNDDIPLHATYDELHIDDVILNDDPSASALQQVPAGRAATLILAGTYAWRLDHGFKTLN